METIENTEELWSLFRHFFPDLSRNHARIYRLLWQIEPLTGEAIIKKIEISRATTYKILNDLLKIGLIKKTNSNPTSYFAENPVAIYSDRMQKLSQRLKRGKNIISQLVENSPSLNEELYLIQSDSGQKRLISKKSRQTIDEFALREIRRTADEQIKQAEQAKLKPWMIGNR